MLAVNFKNVSDTNGIAIDDLFPGGGKADTAFTAASASDASDYIQVWDNSNGKYTTYFLYIPAKASKIPTDPNSYWWCDANGDRANKKFVNGEAMWFYKRGTDTVTATVSGEVELSAVKEIAIGEGWNMIGSYFPAGWSLNDNGYDKDFWKSCGAVPGSASDTSDYIQVWDNTQSKYSTYFLYIPAKASKIDTDPNSYKWCDANGDPATTSIMSVGKGAWYYHRGSGYTLEIKKQF